MIETTLSRDILQLSRVDKPALLRQLFNLGCSYSGQVLSYTKIVGQLQDAGNTTTLAHYLELLGGAGMLAGLHKYAGQKVRQRGSSPKFQVLNNALISAQSDMSLAQAKDDHAYWGRLVESTVGGHLVNQGQTEGFSVLYWREGHNEVDYVVKRGRSITAIEVKTGKGELSLSGTDEFSKKFRPSKMLLIGTGGISVSQFLGDPIEKWLA